MWVCKRQRLPEICAEQERSQKFSLQGYVDGLVRLLGNGGLLGQPEPIHVCSLCAGLDIAHFVWNCVAKAWRAQRGSTLQIHYSCAEIDEQKQAALVARSSMDTFLVKPERVFGDLATLPGPAYDAVSGKDVILQKVNIVTCGFACQDISFMKRARIPFNSDSSGVSSRTFWGCARLVELWQPSIVILENTKGLMSRRSCDEGKTPLETVMKVMHDLGYKGHAELLNSLAFLPQRRCRAWCVFVRANCALSPTLAFSVSHSSPANALSLADLLDDIDAAHDGQQGAASELKPITSQQQKMKWVRKTSAFIKQHKLSPDLLASCLRWLRRRSVFSLLSAREQRLTVARLAWLRQCRKIDASAKCVIFQVDQSLERMPMTVDCAPCVMPKGKYLLIRKHDVRFLRPTELLQLQGLAAEDVPQLGCPLSRAAQFVGESFTAPAFASILLGALSIISA